MFQSVDGTRGRGQLHRHLPLWQVLVDGGSGQHSPQLGHRPEHTPQGTHTHTHTHFIPQHGQHGPKELPLQSRIIENLKLQLKFSGSNCLG